jgi:hypothetical protein
MTRRSRILVSTGLAAATAIAALFASERADLKQPDTLFTQASARIGRPLTPMSYAGVARRTVRRGAYATGAAVAAGAAAGAYYGSTYAAPGCVQAVDAYGQIYWRCP